MKGRANTAVDSLGHGSGVKPVVVVSKNGVEGHGVRQHVRLAMVAAVVIQCTPLMWVLQGVWVHAWLWWGENRVAMVGELDGRNVQARISSPTIHIRENVPKAEVAHVRRHGD